MTRVVVATLAVALAGLSTRVHAQIPDGVAEADVLLDAVFSSAYSSSNLTDWSCTSFDPIFDRVEVMSCADSRGGGHYGWVGGQGTFTSGESVGFPLCGEHRTSICNYYTESEPPPTTGPAYSPRLPSGTRHQLQFQVSIMWGGSTCSYSGIDVVSQLYVRGATTVNGPLTESPPVTSTGDPDPAGPPRSFLYQRFSFEIDTSGVDEIVVGVTRELPGCSVFFKDVRVWFVTTSAPTFAPTATPTTPLPTAAPTSSAPSPEPTFAPTTSGFQYENAPQMVVTFGGDLGEMNAAGQTTFSNELRSQVSAASTTITASDIADVVLAASSTAAGATITATVSFVPNTVTTRDVDAFANTVTATDIEIEVNGVRYSTQGQVAVSLSTIFFPRFESPLPTDAGASPGGGGGGGDDNDPAGLLVGVIVALAVLLIGVTLLFIRYRNRMQRQQAETNEWTQGLRKGAQQRDPPMVPNPTFANRTYAEIDEGCVFGSNADDGGASRSLQHTKPQHQANGLYTSAEDTTEGNVQLHTSTMYESAAGDVNAAPPASPHTDLGAGGGYTVA